MRVYTLIFLILCTPLFANPPKYVWNLGFAMTCDITPFKEGLIENYRTTPAHSKIKPQNYIKKVKDGDIIWLQTFQVAEFCRSVLPKLQKRFFLYICDGDRTFPSSYKTFFDVNSLIRDPRVIHIFGQNVDYTGKDGKVSGIPIGIDYHTIANSEKCALFGETKQTPEEQEGKLEELLTTLPPTHLRLKKAFVDFQLNSRGNNFGETRAAIFKKIYPTGLIDAPSERMARHELWAAKGAYAFSISPHGLGLDCHRTWEDLILGCIVIVKTSPLDPLYEGLPVVIIKDWSEITPENFDKWLEQYGDAFTNPDYRERLTHAYWMNIMRKKQREFLTGKALYAS